MLAPNYCYKFVSYVTGNFPRIPGIDFESLIVIP